MAPKLAPLGLPATKADAPQITFVEHRKILILMVGAQGLEPRTSCVWVRSDHIGGKTF
jgi:hypothetical protein